MLSSQDFSFFLEQLKQICKEYFDRMYLCESQKYDMEFEVRKRDFEVVACPQFWKPVIENLDIQDV